MLNVIRTALGLTFIGIMVLMLMSSSPVQKKERQDLPVIKRISAFRGNHFPGFAEFRVQDFEFTDMGHIILKGEPYELLLNVNYITTVQRYEDAKKTDYSTLVYTNYTEAAFLLRQEYDDVVTSIRKAAEAQVK
tara:strand:- start:822 stop:1223 length:402 start_codon:yes stop_codon:yes gene_type:complete